MNIHNILLWLNAGMPMVNDILNNALFHSNPRINQTLHQILHVLHFRTLDSLLKYAPDYVVRWIEVGAVRWRQMWKLIGVTMISFRVESAIDAKIVWVNTAAVKITAGKICQDWYYSTAAYVTNSLQMSGKLIILFISSWRTSRNRC